MADEEPRIKLLLDTKKMRPACVILQAMAGCAEARGLVSGLFDGNKWVLAPTPDMKIVSGTRAEWEQFAQEVNAQ